MVTVRPATTTAGPAPLVAETGVETDTATPVEGETNDITVVQPRVVELYKIELCREGVRQSVVSIGKPEVTIGRGSRPVAVDVPCQGDPKISRVHITLMPERH